jgi:hypothetical protein
MKGIKKWRITMVIGLLKIMGSNNIQNTFISFDRNETGRRMMGNCTSIFVLQFHVDGMNIQNFVKRLLYIYINMIYFVRVSRQKKKILPGNNSISEFQEGSSKNRGSYYP